MTDEHVNDERMIVLVCWKCGKLIGTRENYYIQRMNNKRTHYKWMEVPVCEGCHA